jgi:hypothetical protein
MPLARSGGRRHHIRRFGQDYVLSWEYEYKVGGSRLLWHRQMERWTDEAGARRFATKWGCPMPEPREAPAETPQGEVLDGD